MSGALILAKDIVRKNLVLLGRCMAHTVNKEAKVQVKRLVYDDYLHMHFPHIVDLVVHDVRQIAKVGDIVLLKKVAVQKAIDVSYEVQKVIYPCGDVTDPLTGRKCLAREFRSDVETIDKAYGRAPDNEEPFDYEKAPDRGWQENKKDFTHKEGYIKWHEFEPGHPLHNDPAAS